MTDCDYGYENVSTVYLGHDNTVTVVPYSDISERILYDMTNVTEVQVTVDLVASVVTGDAVSASSNDNPVTVWWEQVGTTDEWRIYSKVGMFTGLVAGTYTMRIVLIEPAYPNGLVLTDELRVEAVDVP